MHMETATYSRDAWNDVVSRFQDLSLLQTHEYAEAKTQTGWWSVERAVFVDGGRPAGAVQGLVRRLPGRLGGLVWVNRGPLCHQDGPVTPQLYHALLGAMHGYWAKQRNLYLRVAPAVSEDNPVVEAAVNLGYGPTNVRGWASARLDLSRSIEDLRDGLHRKWRNHLSKAERQGLTIEHGTGETPLSRFIAMYTEFLAERKLATTVTPALLSRLQANLPTERRMRVFTAHIEGNLAGAILMAVYGNICEYLAGVVLPAGRDANAGHLLLWQAVCTMKELGYRWLDLSGVDPLTTPSGILYFKSGLGGTPYRLADEIETPPAGWVNRLVQRRVQRERTLTETPSGLENNG